MDTEEIRQGLERIGLSSYQSRAYTTLLEHGALPAVEVAKRSSIPTSRIYDVLTDLEREGYIETFERADKRHARTTEPSDVVDGLRHASEHLSTTAESIEEDWERESLEDHRLVRFVRPVSFAVGTGAENVVRDVPFAQSSSQAIDEYGFAGVRGAAD
jgi:sugar-specific transcriptional regulator TrmB